METPGIGHNSAASTGNWIAISRDMRDHPIVGFGKPVKPADASRGSYSRAEAWQDLIMEARWQRKKVKNKGRIIWLERGELLAARKWLAERWNWTEMTVRWFLSHLSNDQMITRNRNHSDNRSHGHSVGIISICNYDKFQLECDLENLLGNHIDNHSTTTQQPLNNHTETKKQVNNKNTTYARAHTRENPSTENASHPEYDELSRRLCDAAGASLANPATCPGLIVMSDPYRWLENGCDLDFDILPAIRARASRQRQGSIRSWSYFEQSVLEARDRRIAPMPEPEARAAPFESYDERERRRSRAAMQTLKRMMAKAEAAKNG